MQTPHDKTPFIDILRNYAPAVVLILTGFASLVLTWDSIRTNISGLKEVREQVQRQYATQREMNDKTNKEVDVLKLWVEFENGRQEGIKQSKEIKK